MTELGIILANANFGRRLRNAREAAGMTPADLSKASGVPRSVLSRLESARASKVPDPRLTTILKICRALKISVGELLGETPSANADLNREALELMRRAVDLLEKR